MTGITAIVGCRASSSSRSSSSGGGLSGVPSIDVDSTGLVLLVRDVPCDESSLPSPRCLLPLPAHPPISTLARTLVVPRPLRICAPLHPRHAHRRVQQSPRFGRRRLLHRARALDLYSIFVTPWADQSAGHAVEPNFYLPVCHASVQAPPSQVEPVRSATRLFFTFYSGIGACMNVRANDAGDLVMTKGDHPSRSRRATTPQAQTSSARSNTSFRHSPLQDQPMLAVVRAAAERLFVPLTIGGGIKDSVDFDSTVRSALEVAPAYFRAGTDKVGIGSEAVSAVERLCTRGGVADGTSPFETIVYVYGRQAVVVSIDLEMTTTTTRRYTALHSKP
ncbi:hypothetical protein DFH09DRAFT_1491242 [Mycena vulgaris]|nr:hypothetical protein DFH09DRAFT_1491242 [Mycena vulgaris]